MAGSETLSIKVSDLSEQVVELSIAGTLDWSNFAQAEAAIEEIFGRQRYNIVVNLEQVSYISSAGFGIFISSLDTAINNGGKIIFAATPGPIKDVFDILGLSSILTFAPSPQEAMEQFEPAQA